MRFFLLLFLFCFTIREFAQTPEELLQVELKEQENKWDEAAKLYTRFIERNPSCVTCYYFRGRCYQKMNKVQEAFADYSKTISLDNKYVRAYLNRGMLLISGGQPELAVKDNNMVLMLTTDDTLKKAAYVNNGTCKVAFRDFEGAKQDYLKAMAIDSMDAGVRNNLAQIYDELGQPDKAIEELEKTYRLDTTFAGPLVNIGFIKSKQGDYKGAVSYCDRALKLEKNAITYNNRGYAKLKLKQYSQALDDIDLALKMYPGNSYAYRNRALVYFEMKKNKKACEDLLKARELGFEKQYGGEVEDLIRQKCR